MRKTNLEGIFGQQPQDTTSLGKRTSRSNPKRSLGIGRGGVHMLQIGAKGLPYILRQRDLSVGLPFPGAHDEVSRPIADGDIANFELEQFPNPDTGAKKYFENGIVARVHFRRPEQPPNRRWFKTTQLGWTESDGRHLRRGIIRQAMSAHHPPKELFEGNQASIDGCRCRVLNELLVCLPVTDITGHDLEWKKGIVVGGLIPGEKVREADTVGGNRRWVTSPADEIVEPVLAERRQFGTHRRTLPVILVRGNGQIAGEKALSQ